MWEPFGRTFPGLAPAGGEPLTAAERAQVLGSRPLARIGLVPATVPQTSWPLSAGLARPTGVAWQASGIT